MQEALTAQVDAKLEEWKRAVKKKEGAIRNAFGEDGPTYQEFFPQGLSEYTRADKANMEMLMERFRSAAHTHAGEVEADLDTLFGTLKSEYQEARAAQLSKKGTVGDLKDAAADGDNNNPAEPPTP